MTEPTIEKSISNFLLEMTRLQAPRVEQISRFLIKAEKKLFDSMDIDNVPIEMLSTLAKTVSECQSNLLSLMELMRKMIAGSTKIPEVGAGEDVDEISHILKNLSVDDMDALKVALGQIKPALKVVK